MLHEVSRSLIHLRGLDHQFLGQLACPCRFDFCLRRFINHFFVVFQHRLPILEVIQLLEFFLVSRFCFRSTSYVLRCLLSSCIYLSLHCSSLCDRCFSLHLESSSRSRCPRPVHFAWQRIQFRICLCSSSDRGYRTGKIRIVNTRSRRLGTDLFNGCDDQSGCCSPTVLSPGI